MTTSTLVCALLLLSSAATSAFVARPLAPTQMWSTPLLAKKKAAAEEAEDSDRPGMDPAKKAALDGVLNQIERSYGRGSIQKLGEAGNMVVASIPSGALTLDAALGGGFPKGRVVEIYGPESSGKTTLALHAIAESQKLGGTAAFVDAEHALDPSYGT